MLALMAKNENPRASTVLTDIKSSIIQFEEQKVINLAKDIESLRGENLRLTTDKESLSKALDELRNQIERLQNKEKIYQREEASSEIVDRICEKTRAVIGDFEEQDIASILRDPKEEFIVKLSKQTQDDLHFCLKFQTFFSAYDLALLPLFRSLEREIKINIFEPFWTSSEFRQ
ncbi:MAG: hypothetical protein HQK53_17930 [Oligoflexia bacterium]|nr:hypothetical protein [Oligoflexia bacterium]